MVVDHDGAIVGADVSAAISLDQQERVLTIASARSREGDLIVTRSADGTVRAKLVNGHEMSFPRPAFAGGIAAAWLAPDVRLRVPLEPALIVQNAEGQLERLDFNWGS